MGVFRFIVSLVLLFGATATAGEAAESRFADVPGDHLFADDIEWLAAAGITAGCNPPTNDRFCPDRTVTRGQMAAFLVRGLQLPAAAGIGFVDDDGSVFEADIERLAAAGITAGCNPPTNDRFCPDRAVTRAQMAAFMSRALDLDNRSGNPFRDDDGSIFEADIERLAAAGITAGCNPPTNDRFCPDRAVTRAQMAAFLRRGLTSAAADPAPIVPASRRIDWAPGVPGGIPENVTTVNVLDHGAVGDGTTENLGAFRSAVDAVGASGGVVYIPPGRYRIGGSLSIDHGVVLRGAGADATHLEFDLGGANLAAIDVVTYDRGSWRNVSAAVKGGTTILIEDASGISAPAFAEVQQDNDPVLMYTDPAWDVAWADESVGEMVLITEVAGNTLTLAEPLNTTYRPELRPAIRTMGLVEYAGVEDLHVERLDAGDGHIISFKNAAYSWVRRVESEMAFRSHVAATSVYKCEVRDSHFADAHDHGGGGHGYGVSLGRHTTGCLVENNTFESLRHSMIIQVGASGNVFGYNFSVDSHDNSGYLLPDISLHGHYPSMNLFEGNIVEEIGISDWWGPVGPGNTFLRNCVLVEGLFVDDHSHHQNLVGNVLLGSPDEISIDDTVAGTLAHGNYEAGSVTWDSAVTGRTIPASYYLHSPPPFYDSVGWPSIGAATTLFCSNPARSRWEARNP